MATTITIAIGAATISRTYQITNARARDTILAFYAALELGPTDASDQQKVEAAIDWFVKQLRDQAFAKYRFDKRTTIDQEATALYGFE